MLIDIYEIYFLEGDPGIRYLRNKNIERKHLEIGEPNFLLRK